MERIKYQRNSMRIFWNRERQNHVNNPKIDMIYDEYVKWFNLNRDKIPVEPRKPKKGRSLPPIDVNTFGPINKYLFRTYIRKNGYKNAQPKKKIIEKMLEKEKKPKYMDANLTEDKSESLKKLLEECEVVNNKWVIIIKNPNMYHKDEIIGNRVCLFRGKFKQDFYGVVDSIHFIEPYQRVIPVFKNKITGENKYFLPDQLKIIANINENLSIIMKDFLVANINIINDYTETECIIWIKPNVSIYHEIDRITQMQGIKSVDMIRFFIFKAEKVSHFYRYLYPELMYPVM